MNIERVKRIFKYILHGIPEIIVRPEIVTISHIDAMKDKVILITGGNRGLGKAIAKKCVEEGAKVILVGRNEESLRNVSLELGERAAYIQYDVSDCSHFENIFQEAEKKFGYPVSVLVNSAGVSYHEGSYKNVTENGWDEQMSINLKGVYFLTKTFAENCIQKGIKNASVVILSSERGMYGDDIPYGLTKAALNSYIKGMARRLITFGIRVNGVAPGITATDMTGINAEGNLYSEALCGKRIFLAEEVAEVVAFLIRDTSKCVSGEIIACNQGNHLRSDF